MRLGLLLLIVVLCGGTFGSQVWAGEAENLFADPGFEAGGARWSKLRGSSLALGGKVTDEIGYESPRSALLELDSSRSAVAGPNRATSIAQSVQPKPFPVVLRGRLRVEDWTRGDDDMGLQLKAIVGVWRDPRTAEILAASFPGSTPPARPFEVYAVHYQLVGRGPASLRDDDQSIEPGPTPNVQTIEIGSATPELGSWTTFELPIGDDFERVWGTVPEGYEYLSFIFQLIWLDREPGTTVRAKVYLDDLMLLPPSSPD